MVTGAAARLIELIARHAPGDGTFATPIAGVSLIRWSTPTEPMPTIYEPTLCIVAQGRKRASVGTTSFVYDRAQHLIASVGLPVMGSVIEATADAPYLCLQIDLDTADLAELILRHPEAAPQPAPAIGLTLDDTAPEMLDAASRLVALLDTPRDIAELAPLALGEIRYRLLKGSAGGVIRHMARGESRLNQIARAILWLRRHYREACRIEDAAAVAGMSRSAFHHHFRDVTGLTPIEFRTQLRLQAAQRLMVAEGQDAAAAGFAVGYESPSQFSRDYSRLFGVPPARDATRLRAALAA
jgi:AraC-like DNA-binding protein